MNLIWNSSKHGTLDLGHKKLKRAKRAYKKAFMAHVHARTIRNEEAAFDAFDALEAARQSAANKTERALKKLGR